MILFQNVLHDGKEIKTQDSVNANLYFVDRILFTGGNNPYRNTEQREIKIECMDTSNEQKHQFFKQNAPSEPIADTTISASLHV